MSLDITLKTKQDSLCFNITHNLTKMASAAKIYSILWRPQEAGIKKAGQLIEPLEVGIKRMKILDVPQSGSLGGQTSSHNRAGQYRRARRSPVQPTGTGGADHGRSGGRAASRSPKMAISPPIWTAAAGGGALIFPLNHKGTFFKTNPNDGPVQN